MKAVVDASVLVSAFLFPESMPGRVLQLAEEKRFFLQLSLILREETRRSLLHRRLRTTYDYDEDTVETWLVALDDLAVTIARPLPQVRVVCRDPNDAHVLAAAVASGAQRIVTGDKDLLSLVRYDDVSIVTARDFITGLDEDDR